MKQSESSIPKSMWHSEGGCKRKIYNTKCLHFFLEKRGTNNSSDETAYRMEKTLPMLHMTEG